MVCAHCLLLHQPRAWNQRNGGGGESEDISNTDTLKAVVELTRCFTTLEQNISKNTDNITTECKQLRGMEIQEISG